MIHRRKLEPHELLPNLDGVSMTSFWAWAYSDILSNTNRGVFAEFLVAVALGIHDGIRIEWDAVDLEYRGKRIEVKSAAYVQSWEQQKGSSIRFDLGKKKSWEANTNISAVDPLRSSDCYVFCLLAETDKTLVNVIDVRQWQFFVIPTTVLNTTFGNQKSVALSRIRFICDPVSHEGIRQRVHECLEINE